LVTGKAATFRGGRIDDNAASRRFNIDARTAKLSRTAVDADPHATVLARQTLLSHFLLAAIYDGYWHNASIRHVRCQVSYRGMNEPDASASKPT
jgi:hypothetical protein